MILPSHVARHGSYQEVISYHGSYQVQELVESGNQMISVVRLVSNLVKHLQNQPHSNIVLGCNVCNAQT